MIEGQYRVRLIKLQFKVCILTADTGPPWCLWWYRSTSLSWCGTRWHGCYTCRLQKTKDRKKTQTFTSKKTMKMVEDGVLKLKLKHLLALRHSHSVLKSVQLLIAIISLDFLLLELLCTFTNLKKHHYFHITCWNHLKKSFPCYIRSPLKRRCLIINNTFLELYSRTTLRRSPEHLKWLEIVFESCKMLVRNNPRKPWDSILSSCSHFSSFLRRLRGRSHNPTWLRNKEYAAAVLTRQLKRLSAECQTWYWYCTREEN